MLKTEALRGPGGHVVLMDSITQVDASDAGAFVVSGSHGGTSSGEFALAVPLGLTVFNDAGIGKDEAGIAALAMAQALLLSHSLRCRTKREVEPRGWATP